MKYLIVGRTASGKSYFADLLKKEGFKIAKSTTTRPKRDDEDDAYHFISSDKAETISEKIAATTHNGYEYFLTNEEIENSDVIIVDPAGVIDIANAYPKTAFALLHITADSEVRKFRFASRDKNNPNAFRAFDLRNQDEDEMFTEFETTFIPGFQKDKQHVNIVALRNIKSEDKQDLSIVIKQTKHIAVIQKQLCDMLTLLFNENLASPDSFEINSANASIDCIATTIMYNRDDCLILLFTWLKAVDSLIPSLTDAIYYYQNYTKDMVSKN